MTKDGSNNVPTPPQGVRTPLVERSTNVPAVNDYRKFKPYLREDFFRSCAYCTMSEAEAQAKRFTIDHYEPQNGNEHLENEYSNCMYACDECNTRKGDISPPPEARADGYKYFRPDEDFHEDHFELSGQRLNYKTNTGEYSVEALDLNRTMLRNLRHVRERLTKCDAHVVGGVLALKTFPIDQLPPEVRGRALAAIKRATAAAEAIADDVDSILQKYATSPHLDALPDTDQHKKERQKKLKTIRALYNGNWRAPRPGP